MSPQRWDETDACLTRPGEREEAEGCWTWLINAASIGGRHRRASTQREDQEGCYAGINQPELRDNRLPAATSLDRLQDSIGGSLRAADRPGAWRGDPSMERIWEEGLLSGCRSDGTGSEVLHHPTVVNLMTGMNTRRGPTQKGSPHCAWMPSAQPGGKAIAVRRTRWLRWRSPTSGIFLPSPG